MKRDAIQNGVRAHRAGLGLTQQQLASQCDLSRQTLNAIEGGHVVPSAASALRLAAALGCKVEALFWLPEQPKLDVEIAGGRAAGRLVVGYVDGRCVGHRVDERGALTAADAVVGARGVRPLRPEAELKQNVLIAGCAPPLGLLSARLPGRVAWVPASSVEAIDALAQGQVHLAGAHLSANDAEVQRRMPNQKVLAFNLVGWQAGFVTAPGNPRKIRKAEDLAKPGVRVVRREEGAAAQRLLNTTLAKARIPASKVGFVNGVVHSHEDVARVVAWGAADVGVAIEPVARAHGLTFVPLDFERFDLFVPASFASDERISRVWDLLASQSFRRELGALGGYETRLSGQPVSEISPS